MVEGEKNAERTEKGYSPLPRLEKAASRCRVRLESGMLRTRPSFHELLDNADQSVKSKQYQDARTKLDDVHRRFPHIWSRDADAARLDKEVDFHLHFETARRSHGKGDLAAA